jgi:hypothetical protein
MESMNVVAWVDIISTFYWNAAETNATRCTTGIDARTDYWRLRLLQTIHDAHVLHRLKAIRAVSLG